MKKRVLIIGGNGHGSVIAACIIEFSILSMKGIILYGEYI